MSHSTCYELAARYFRTCIRFNLSPPTLRDPYGSTREAIPLTSLDSSFAKKYHFKDTAVYNFAVPHPYVEDVFDEIWKTWYPRRNTEARMDKNIEAFFCRHMKLESGFGTDIELKDVVGFHDELVRVIDEDEEERNRIKAELGDEITEKRSRQLNGGLEESFRKVFMVLDKEDWEKDGALVVCRVDCLGEFGLEEYVSGGDGESEEGRGRPVNEKWVAFRKGMAEAVKTVICDPERKKAEAPTEENYREKKFGF